MFKSLLPSAAAAFALLLMPATASAHTKLVSSTPAANSTVSKVTSVNLQFNEKIVASTLKTELDADAQAAADSRNLQGHMVGGGR